MLLIDTLIFDLYLHIDKIIKYRILIDYNHYTYQCNVFNKYIFL